MRAENPFSLHVWRLCLAWDLFFFLNHYAYHYRILQDTPSRVFLNILFRFLSHHSPWSATKKTTLREEARNSTIAPAPECPAVMKKVRVRPPRGLLTRLLVGIWDTVTPSDAQESD